jgi:hypothetical protein
MNPIQRYTQLYKLSHKQLARLLGVTPYYIANLVAGIPTPIQATSAVARVNLLTTTPIYTHTNTTIVADYDPSAVAEEKGAQYVAFEHEYRHFQKCKRLKAGVKLKEVIIMAKPGDERCEGVSTLNENWVRIRESIFGDSARATCSAICLHPQVLTNFESRERLHFKESKAIYEALLDCFDGDAAWVDRLEDYLYYVK